MKPRMKVTIAALMLLFAAMSCNLPARSTDFNTPGAPSQSEGTSSNTGNEPDFSQVRLELADLPQGFDPVSQSELAQFGINPDSILASISALLAKAEPQNLTAYSMVNGLDTTIVISFIVQPLTLLEKGAVDLLARNPQQAANQFNQAVSDLTFSPMSQIETVGDAALGITFSHEKSTVPIDGDLILSRRGQVIQAAMVASLRGGNRAISGLDVARIMDRKVQAALE